MIGLALKKTNLAEQAYAVIQALLLEGGRFLPGDKISVEELTRDLGVSRSPVWAAINRLAAEGIVEVRPRHGVFFTGFDVRRMRELYEVRMELEAMAVRLAAAGAAKPSDVAALRASLERQALAVAAGDVEGYSREGSAFHFLIADACGNSVLAETLHRLLSRIRAMCLARNRLLGDLGRHVVEHTALVDAIATGDGAAAERTIRAHMRRVAGLESDGGG